MKFTRRITLAFGLAAATLAVSAAPAAWALDPPKLTAEGRETLAKLVAEEPRARLFRHHAVAELVFPGIIKGAFVFGGATGDGVLLEHGRAVGFYNLSSASWGLQIGGQKMSYVLFFMKPSALDYLKKSDGFSLGTGPSITVIDKSAAASANTDTLTQDVYAFPFNGKGLMAALDINGTKITPIH